MNANKKNSSINEALTTQDSFFKPSSSPQSQSINRGQFRTYQSNTLDKQIQTEFTVSILITIIICAVMWKLVPLDLLSVWSGCIIILVGLRSLFVAGFSEKIEHSESKAWGTLYNYFTALSGIGWGCLGIIAVLNSDLPYQIFVMVMLMCISLTAYVSMQHSPWTLALFVLPTLTPISAWFFYQGGMLQYSLGTVSIIIAMLMISYSRGMREILIRSFRLSSHNTELIKKLVVAREAAEKAKRYAEEINTRLQVEIKERKRAEEEIRASKQQLSSIFDNMQDTVYQIDTDGNVLWTTPSVQMLLGLKHNEVVNKNINDFYIEDDGHDEFKKVLDTNFGQIKNYEKRLQHAEGFEIWTSENAHYKYDRNGCINGIEGSIRDITALKKAQEALFQEQERAQVTLGSIGDGVITTDLDGNIEYMNKVAEQAIGWKLDDTRGKPIMKVVKIVDEKTLQSPPDPVKLCLLEGNNVMLPGYLLLIHSYLNQRMSVEVIASPIRDSNSVVIGVVLVFHDVSELRSLAKMTYQASHDSLTGLINRREFEKRVSQVVDNARNKDGRYALCYLDLDNFKIVNDTSGHVAGDELLKQLTIKLRMEMREADTLARLGGDEFGLLLAGCSIRKALELTERFRKLVEDFRFVWDNKSFRIGVSVGLVQITADSGSLSDVLSAADSACYVAKEQGRNRIHVYQPNDKAVAEHHGQLEWVHRIHDVLEKDRFRLYFQPIKRLCKKSEKDHRTHGEVLLRVLDDNGELIGPGSFIPSAERYNLMPTIDRWVVENTIRILSANREQATKTIDKCCINLSGQSLSDERFTKHLIEVIKNAKVSPSILCFEITETAVIANLSVASNLIATLRDMGCCFALDDFGVGLSSFGYLKNLSVDYLKLDGCFVKNMMSDNIDHAMVKAINHIGHTMNIKTIAEFVESQQLLHEVEKIGVDYAQGYAVAKPVPFEGGLFNDKAESKNIDDEEKKTSALEPCIDVTD